MNQDIESYLDGTLDPAARAIFEAQLAQDEVLRTALMDAQRLRADLEWLRISQGVKQGEQAFWDTEKAKKRQRLWIWGGTGFAVLLIACMLYWPKTNSTMREAPGPAVQQDTTSVFPGNIRLDPEPTSPSANDSIQKERRATGRRLFAAKFKPYKDESLDPTLRGGSDETASEKFQQLYWDGRYGEALAQFETIPAFAKSNDNLLFLKAECLLAVGKTEEAKSVFELILRNDKSRYVEEAAWHLALTDLKRGRFEQAKTRLGEIGRSGSKYRKEAVELLKRIQ